MANGGFSLTNVFGAILSLALLRFLRQIVLTALRRTSVFSNVKCVLESTTSDRLVSIENELHY